jgi:hypothetical protein
VFMHGLVTDRLRNDPEFGWRICARIVEDTTANTALSPPSHSDTVGARHGAQVHLARRRSQRRD